MRHARLVRNTVVAWLAMLVVFAVPAKYHTAFGFDGRKPAVTDPGARATSQPAADEAQRLVQEGKMAALEARSTDDADRKSQLEKQARASFARAREMNQADCDRFKAEYDRFDKFIPKTDTARFEARERVFGLFVQAQLQLAVLKYEEALTWDKGADERRQLLTDGANAFELIHARYRQMLAGLYARMWQGRCLEDRGDITKALGIYNELLEHEAQSTSDALARLQDRVRLLRLSCLRQHREDNALVIDEARAWLDANPEKAATPTGLGIQWELACASSAQSSKPQTPAVDRKRLLRQALAAARTVVSQPGEYKAPAQTLIERLKKELEIEPGDLN